MHPRRLLLHVPLAIIAIFIESAFAGTVSFAPPISYSSGGRSDSEVVADFNRDGKPDIAVNDGDSHSVAIFLGNGDSTFQAPVHYRAGEAAIGLAVGDVNGDGKLDLVAVGEIDYSTGCGNGTSNGDGGVWVLLGNGDGTFQPPACYESGGPRHSRPRGPERRRQARRCRVERLQQYL